jgi:hypothetical protein
VSQEQIAKVLRAEFSVDENVGEYDASAVWGSPEEIAAVLAPLFAEAQAEALREAADEMGERITRLENTLVDESAYHSLCAMREQLIQDEQFVRSRATHIEGRALVAKIHERKGLG